MENQDNERAPLLSVTVLNYNYAHYLPECLDSILRQTWTDFEIILINDCSTDDSLGVIERYLADPRIRLVNHTENQGFVPSLIEGAQLSRGKYITVISADDYCVSDRAFETLLQMLEEDASAVFAYSAYGEYAHDGVRRHLCCTHPHSFVRSGVDAFREIVIENFVLHSGTIVRRSAYQAVGGYDASTRYAVDGKMWLLLCSQGQVAYCADELYAYRVHLTSMSKSRDGIRTGLREVIEGIEAAFTPLQGSLSDAGGLRRRALKNALVAVATNYVFSGHLRAGWYSYWCGVRAHPLLTICQRRTLILLARTVLGPRHIHTLRLMLARHRQPAVL